MSATPMTFLFLLPAPSRGTQHSSTHSKNRRFAEAFPTTLLTYGLGRSLELTDEKTVKELTAKFIESDYRIANLIQLVVASEPFHKK